VRNQLEEIRRASALKYIKHNHTLFTELLKLIISLHLSEAKNPQEFQNISTVNLDISTIDNINRVLLDFQHKYKDIFDTFPSQIQAALNPTLEKMNDSVALLIRINSDYVEILNPENYDKRYNGTTANKGYKTILSTYHEIVDHCTDLSILLLKEINQYVLSTSVNRPENLTSDQNAPNSINLPENVLKSHCCPVTRYVFRFPVEVDCGNHHLFEEDVAKKLLNHKCPLCNQNITSYQIDHNKIRDIDAFLSDFKTAKEEQYPLQEAVTAEKIFTTNQLTHRQNSYERRREELLSDRLLFESDQSHDLALYSRAKQDIEQNLFSYEHSIIVLIYGIIGNTDQLLSTEQKIISVRAALYLERALTHRTPENIEKLNVLTKQIQHISNNLDHHLLLSQIGSWLAIVSCLLLVTGFVLCFVGITTPIIAPFIIGGCILLPSTRYFSPSSLFSHTSERGKALNSLSADLREIRHKI